MAIARGAGTEIIRSAHFEDIDDTDQKLIQGVQHHIYTVLSVVIYCIATQAATNTAKMRLVAYDAKAGTSAQHINIFAWTMTAGDTFVWNDKFSFNGFEPTDFSGPMDDAAKQDAIADQGSGVAQYMALATTNAADDCEIHVTYIDQNNA
tara:strand:- start:120 stop:569 length:450 start_codon:yes stop_codon:yes gene_type:complete